MTLATYISDLLYRYECVIVPDFGGFITNPISAKLNTLTHTFYAPSRQLTFNSHLQKGDGLLAHYVATCKNITYKEAVSFIALEVDFYKNKLTTEKLVLENLGSFSLNNENKLFFEPSNEINYLTASFGFSTFVSPEIKQSTFAEKVRNLDANFSQKNQEKVNRKAPIILKYAAAAAVIFTLGTVGWKQFENYQYNNLVVKAVQQQQKLEQKIQEATFVISNPLPSITLNIAKETFNYHIIAGAFREPENAETKLQELLKKGYPARILGVNKWNLTQVAFGSFKSEKEAINKLNIINRTESKDAWLLVEEH